jgi:hypothetical protein
MFTAFQLSMSRVFSLKRVHKHLDRIAAMLSKLGGRGYCVKEEQASYGEHCFDPDSDTDSEPDNEESQQGYSTDG